MNTEARLGRPPASSSAETRGRIIDVARRCFASVGFEATTNRVLAQDAGITTGAIYHYFDSKLDIYRAVNEEVQGRVYQRFATAERNADTFYEKMEAVLEAASDLNTEDPTLAKFIGASRIDRSRIPEITEAFGAEDPRREGFFESIVRTGVETGEIHPDNGPAVRAMIHAFTIGLTDGLSDDAVEHRNAIEGLKVVLRGMVAEAKLAD